MQICIFEDEKYKNFYPLTYSRPVYDLVCGIKSIKEKIIEEFPEASFILHCRKYLENIVKSYNQKCNVNGINGNECLFINGRVSSINGLKKLADSIGKDDVVYKNGGTVIIAKLSGQNLSRRINQLPEIVSSNFFDGVKEREIDIKCYNYLWEMISENGEKIKSDIEKAVKNNKYKISGKYDGVSFVEKGNIFLGKNVTIKPGVVVDATKGPVLIDGNTFIFPNAVIEGPVYIGKNSQIKSGAAINENVSIGSVCKIGGEVEDSVILSYSNKQHSGFIGHSYLGSWVNLGADTNCSDLKNNYSTVKVNLNGKSIDTGLQFLGVIIGDHSKTAINTMFNTGTVVGFSSNIFGAGFPPKYIPSFSWGGFKGLSEYDLQKGLETARIVMKRRDVEFLPADKEVFENIFNLTADERNG